MRPDMSAIKSLCNLGFSLIPLHPKSKRPVGDKWNEKPKLTFEEFQKKYKLGQNIGVLLGSASNLKDETYLLCVDCDLKSDKEIHKRELEEALKASGLDVGLVSMSGRGNGSHHRFFKSAEPLEKGFRLAQSSHSVKVHMPSVEASSNDKATLTAKEVKAGFRMRPAWEIDVKGKGTQVVLPPSVHPDSGLEYSWAEGRGPSQISQIPLAPSSISGRVSPDWSISKIEVPEIEFVDVDLKRVKISQAMKDLITTGKGLDTRYRGDRSSAIMAALVALCDSGLRNNLVMSVMLDSEYSISEKSFERGESLEGAIRWLWPQLMKARAQAPQKEKARSSDGALREKGSDIALGAFNVYDEEGNVKEENEENEDNLKEDWTGALQTSKNGTVLPSLFNHHLALKFSFPEPFKENLKFNTFSNRKVFFANPIWANRNLEGKEISDAAVSQFMHHCSSNASTDKIGLFEPRKDAAYLAFDQLAFENSYHPVRDYLNQLEWDGVERLDKFLIDYIRCIGPKEYIKAVGRKTLVAAIARIMKPGCKFDHMLILEGYQGIGKSTALNILGGEWFTDALGSIAHKDYIQSLEGNWIVEMGELATMGYDQNNSIKGFMSRKVDRARPAYGRTTDNFPRQCVIIGTTNDKEYLKDPSGNRRYWPVEVTSIDLKKLKEDRDQLFAEAKTVYDSRAEKLYLDSALLRKQAKEQQGLRQSEDPMTEKVRLQFEESPLAKQHYHITELWVKFQGLSGRDMDFRERKRFAQALRSNGWDKEDHRNPETGKVVNMWFDRNWGAKPW